MEVSQLSKNYTDNKIELLMRNNTNVPLEVFRIQQMHSYSSYDSAMPYNPLPIGDTNVSMNFPQGSIYGFKISYNNYGLVTKVRIKSDKQKNVAKLLADRRFRKMA